MLYSRGDRFERHFRRANRIGDEDYYYGVQDKDEYDEYEEDEFM